MKNLVEKCNVNLNNILNVALRKIGDKITKPGSVSPRVLKHIIDEGRFCEDQLTAEYYGGILASSRSEYGRDDRAVTYLCVIKELSTYQIRLHYMFYTILKKIFNGKDLNLHIEEDREKMCVYIPIGVYSMAMEFSESENMWNILHHSLEGLSRHELIDNKYFAGKRHHLPRKLKKLAGEGLIVCPSFFGADLFLQASGYRDISPGQLIDYSIVFEEPILTIKDGFKPIHL